MKNDPAVFLQTKLLVESKFFLITKFGSKLLPDVINIVQHRMNSCDKLNIIRVMRRLVYHHDFNIRYREI